MIYTFIYQISFFWNHKSNSKTISTCKSSKSVQNFQIIKKRQKEKPESIIRTINNTRDPNTLQKRIILHFHNTMSCDQMIFNESCIFYF